MCCSEGSFDGVPYMAAADLLQGAKHFDVALVTCSTLGNILISLALAFGAIMLQTGFALQKAKSKYQCKESHMQTNPTM